MIKGLIEIKQFLGASEGQGVFMRKDFNFAFKASLFY